MIVRTVFDVVDLRAVSAVRLAAVIRSQPGLAQACAEARPVIDLNKLAGAVQQALPEALDIDIGMLLGRDSSPAEALVSTRVCHCSSDLELSQATVQPIVMRLRAEVQLEPAGLPLRASPSNEPLSQGKPQRLHAKWKLFLATHPGGTPLVFAEGRRDVRLSIC